jgi:hypothetical protein
VQENRCKTDVRVEDAGSMSHTFSCDWQSIDNCALDHTCRGFFQSFTIPVEHDWQDGRIADSGRCFPGQTKRLMASAN